MLALEVYPSPSRPHHLIREGTVAGIYVRVGSTNRRADTKLIEELRRFARGEGFDEQPMPGLDSEALDFRAASEPFARHRKLGRRDLETLRLVTQHQASARSAAGRPRPPAAAGGSTCTSTPSCSRPAAARHVTANQQQRCSL